MTVTSALAGAIFDADERFGTLEAALRSVTKTVRALRDDVLVTGALPSWQSAAVGTASFPTTYFGGNGVGPNKITSASGAGQRAMLRCTNASGPSIQTIQPNNFVALAWTVEGLVFDADAGFDFSIGFVAPNGLGGVQAYQKNGQIGGGVRCFTPAGVEVDLPKFITDGVTTAGSNIVTSASAPFVSSQHLWQPIGNYVKNANPPVPLIGGTIITSVDSTSQVQVGRRDAAGNVTAMPALSSQTGLALAIGQQPYFRVFSTNGGGRWRKNITVLWLPKDQLFYVLRNDQVVAEIDLSMTALDPSVSVQVETTVTSQEAATHSLSWAKTELLLAHD